MMASNSRSIRRDAMKWLVLAAAVLIGGCSHDVGPTQEDLKVMWEQQNVFPQNYKSDLLAFMRTYLNDPSHVRGAQVSQPFRKKMGLGDRYITCVRFNARNTDGRYLGEKEGAVVYVGGKLNRYVDEAHEVKDLCTDVALGAFPELEKLTR